MAATLSEPRTRVLDALVRAQRRVEATRQTARDAHAQRCLAVAEAHRAGVPFSKIAATLGLTKSAAQWLAEEAEQLNKDSHAAGTHHPGPENRVTRPMGRPQGLRENNGNQDPGT